MRVSSYRLAVLLCYLTSMSLIILTCHHLVDGDKVNLANETESFIKSDSELDRARANQYSPLQLTNNSRTLYDIRRGARGEAPQNIGVSAETELDISDQNIPVSSANRTVESNVLIYNRVPKCASTSMQGILRHLAKKNSFKFESSSIYWR